MSNLKLDNHTDNTTITALTPVNAIDPDIDLFE